MSERARPIELLQPAIVRAALVDALRKLAPRHQLRNPVMFVVWVGSAFTTALSLAPDAARPEPRAFVIGVAAWLWATVWFANFAESLAEGRGKAQANSLRRLRQETPARRVREDGSDETVSSTALRRGDRVRVAAGELIPLDGRVTEGCATVDESAVTGESAPVLRESGGDRDAVTGGTRVLSDQLVIEIASDPGESFLDRMIRLVEGARRGKTPNEIALDILLAGLTLVFLLATVTLWPFTAYAARSAGQGQPIGLATLAALLVCLIPTTIGALLSAIGIAGMDRMVQANVVATSGRAVETAGDVDVLLLDKTGTITYGNRQAAAFLPAPGVSEARLAEAAWRASLADETPEGRSIVGLATSRFGLQADDQGGTPIPFTAQTRMSGLDLGARQIRKGAADVIERWVTGLGGSLPEPLRAEVQRVARAGGTPLVVADNGQALGVIQLKDVLKPGIRERFAELREMGITTIMITGDNPLTAAAIAAEAGVDDYLAEATPEAKLAMIRDYQTRGHLVAMTGDGTNDAPALAQADVAVAMASGTAAAREAGNLVDLDSDPTKLVRVVHIGKQMLMTRGALTTFSISNDVAKYFAILPVAFAGTWPGLRRLDLMGLDPRTAILSAVIFNALIIVALVPLALRGVAWRPMGAASLLRRNLLIYGLGGLLVPFFGIKIIDLALSALVTELS